MSCFNFWSDCKLVFLQNVIDVSASTATRFHTVTLVSVAGWILNSPISVCSSDHTARPRGSLPAAAHMRSRAPPSPPPFTHPISANSIEGEGERPRGRWCICLVALTWPGCMCVLKRGEQGHCQGIRKGEWVRDRGGSDGWRGPKPGPSPLSLLFAQPNTHPPRSRLSEAGDRRRVGLCVCVCSRGVAGAIWRVDVRGQTHGLGHLAPLTHTQTRGLSFPPVTVAIKRTRRRRV